MKFDPHHDDRAGFTLIELVIASALMALILASAYACLSAGYSSRKIVEPRAEILQNARVAMALIAADLRSACPLSPDAEFIGMTRTLGDAEADNLDFATHNYTPKRAREGDYCQESIYLDQNPATGSLSLYRRRNPLIGLDPLSGGSREEIAQGVRGLKLEYYDGIDWYSSWGEVKSESKQQTSNRQADNLDGLPLAVRITLYLDSNPHPLPKPEGGAAAPLAPPEPPLVFQTVARINLSEASAAAGANSSSAGDMNSDQDSNQHPGGNPGQNGN